MYLIIPKYLEGFELADTLRRGSTHHMTTNLNITHILVVSSMVSLNQISDFLHIQNDNLYLQSNESKGN